MNCVNSKAKFWNPYFYNFFSFSCIKMSKTLSAKYYQENKDRLQKKLVKDIKIFLKKKKKKSYNMVMNVKKISQKIKNKIFLSIEKNIIKWEKIPYYKN